MTTILLLTDFSIRAGYAAEYATHMAIKIKANILLCNAIEAPAPIATEGNGLTWPISNQQVLKNESIVNLNELKKRLEKLIAHNNKGTYKPSISYTTNFGLLADVTAKVIIEKAIDMVIIGSHKSSRLSRLLSGSHTHAILDKIDCPVLLVPETLEFNGINSIAYATDLTFDNTKVINYLIEVAKPVNAVISVSNISRAGFPVNGSAKAGQSLSEHSQHDYPRVIYHNIKGYNVKTSLLEVIKSQKADILTLVHKHYDFFDALFHNSISKQMADSAAVPLLIMPHSYSLSMPDLTNNKLQPGFIKNANP